MNVQALIETPRRQDAQAHPRGRAIASWLGRPLCRRYAFVQFMTLQARLQSESITGTNWQWALGMLADGQCDVLGAWPDDGDRSMAHIAENLHARGVERIGVIAGAAPAAFALQRAKALEWPPAATATTGSDEAIRHAIETARRVQTNLRRGLNRRAPFPDDAAVAEYLVQALQRADRRLDAQLPRAA